MRVFVWLVLSLVFSSPATAADPVLQAFAEKFAAAKAADDFDTLMSMHYSEGLSADDVAWLREQLKTSAKYKRPTIKPPRIIAVADLGSDVEDPNVPRIFDGHKVEPTLPVTGMIETVYEGGKGWKAFGTKNGKPWLIGLKRTKLNWNGPTEDPHTVAINNGGDAEIVVMVEATFRGSGVDQKLTTRRTVPAKGFTSAGLRANELLSVRVTCEAHDTELSASIFKQVTNKSQDIVAKTPFSAIKPFVFTANATK